MASGGTGDLEFKEEKRMTFQRFIGRVGALFVIAGAMGGCDRAALPSPEPPTEPIATTPPTQNPQPRVPDKGEPPRQPDSTNDSKPSGTAPPLFDGWPQPQVALVLTGQQLGYIEPCGCTGLENQKGGLARRHSLLKQLATERGWTVVPLDVGNQVRRFGKQSEIKFQQTAEALRQMGYKAMTLGADDLKLPAGDLLNGTNPPDKESLFVSANVALLSRELQPTHVVIEAGGKRIGVTAVLGDKYEQALKSDELVHSPAIESLQPVCEKLKESRCDLLVLLAHAPVEEARKIAAETAIFDLVVVPGATTAASLELEEIEGAKGKLLKTGTKGMFAGVVGVFDDPKRPLRYESVPLDAQLPDSPQMLKMLAEYQERLRTEIELTPQPHPSGRSFVGSEKCGECHTKAFEKWSSTPHAHATDSLVHPPNSRGEIARHYDPECLSCHVTGWEPQKFFPFETGYLDLQKSPLLQHNGCENCHGPGSAHVAAEEATDVGDSAKRREEMKLPLAGGVAERKCLECHDDDNSPDFHSEGAFAKYWKKVEHRGKD
jgi:hypothetical protein